MLYIFDKDDKFQNIITEDTGLSDTWFKDYQNHLIDEPFKFHVDSESELLPLIVAENQVAFYDRANRLRLMRIKEPFELYDGDGYVVEVMAEPSWLELHDHFVEDRRVVDGEAQTALNRALDGSRYTGDVQVELGLNTTNFYWIDAVEAIFKTIETWGGSLVDTIELDENNEIIERKILIVERLGADNGLLIQPDYNAETIERRTLSYPITAMYGQGASLEIEDDDGELTGGHTRYITFEDVEWKKSKGDPVDKPKGQKWVGDPQALAKYGYLKDDGSRMHRFGHFSNQDYETPEELLKATWQALQEEKEPEVYHEAVIDEVDKDVFLGDTATILDRHYGKPIEVQSQLTGIEYDILEPNENVKVVVGNYKDMSRDPLEDDIDEIKNNQKKPVIVDSGNFPDKKPAKPTGVEAVGSWETIQVTWDYTDEIYVSHYEVYASQNKDFVPDSQFLVYNGKVSAFGHEVKTDEVWYYRVCAVNYRGTKSEYSDEAMASTNRIPIEATQFEEIVDEAINKADEAYTNANIATDNAMSAIDKAQEGFDKAQQAIDDAGSADSKANQAITKAQEGFDKAQESLDELTTLMEFVDENTGEIATIKGSVQGLQTTVQDNEGNITTLQQTASDFATRIEDTEGNISSLSQTVQGFQQTVSNIEGDVTEVTQLANGLQNRVTNAEGEISTLTQTASQFDSRIGEIEDWEIGGRNYIENGYPYTNSHWYFTERDKTDNSSSLEEGEITIENDNDGWKQWQISTNREVTSLNNITLDEEYTLSLEMKNIDVDSSGSGVAHIRYGSINQLVLRFDASELSTTWKRYSITDVIDQSAVEGYAYIRIILQFLGKGKVSFRKVKLEKGDKATDWLPAPEDTDQKFSAINQTIDSIATRVQTTEDDYSSLSQTVQGFQSTVSNMEGDISQVTQLANAHQRRLTTVDGSINELMTTANSLQSRIVEVNSDIDDLTLNMLSEIIQLSDAINLRVQKGDVRSQINIEADRVLIDTSGRLILNAQSTLISNAIIKNAHIDSLSGQKITSESITTDKLNVTNLGAITANLGTVTGGKITQQSSGRRLEMQDGEIESFYNDDLAMKFGQYSLDFYNKRNDRIGRIVPVANTTDRDKKGLGFIVDGDILNIGFEKGSSYRAVLRTDFVDNVTTLSGPYNNLNAGSTLRLFANRRQVSEGRFTSHDQPSIILNQSDTSNDIDIYYGGFGKRTNASTYFRHRTSDSTYSTTMRVAPKHVRIYDELRIGSTDHPSGIVPFANSIHWRYNTNNYLRQTETGNFRVYAGNNSRFEVTSAGNVSASGDLIIPSAYNRTTGNSVNVHVFNTGRFARSTSARKYKEYIEVETSNIDYEKILDFEIKSWYDKGELQQNGGSTTGLKRYYGLIADEFVEKGLDEFSVIENGEVENYSDRAWVTLIPNIRDNRDAIANIDTKLNLTREELILEISKLESRISKLESAA